MLRLRQLMKQFKLYDVSLSSHDHQLSIWQHDEPHWSDILAAVESGSPPPSPDVTCGWTREAQLMVRDWHLLTVHDGLLFRDDRTGPPRVWVPRRFNNDLIRLYHDSPGSSHEGMVNLYLRLKRLYYWPSLKSDIAQFTAQCATCQKSKKNIRQPCHPLMPIQAGFPNQRVHTDFAGPLSTTSSGNRYLLVLVDAFSGYVAAVPTKDLLAPTTAMAFIRGWVAYFGLPDHLHTDRGSNFESLLMQVLCDQFGIRKTRTTSYHPQSNGRAETTVKTIKS